jgi:serine protease Do
MKRRISWPLWAILGCLLAGGPVPQARAQRPDSSRATARAEAGAQLSAARRNVISAAAQRVSPAVVTVSVEATRLVRMDPFGGMFRDPFFDQFMPAPERAERISGLGSGVIVDPTGVVLTNEHVVRDAQKVSVTLPDGRQFPAEVLGASTAYDLAVLRVKGSRLPAAPLGHSDDLVVGEWAIAIGNPFGNLLENTEPTVTAGVISATDRDIKGAATATGVYKHMVQTDAAINLARRILDEVTRYGRVRVAWPGMQVQVVDERLAQQLGWTGEGGMVVTRINAGGPAAKAGVLVRDRIRKVNGRAVNSVDDIQASVYGLFVGDHLTLTIEREGRTLALPVTLAEAPRTAE